MNEQENIKIVDDDVQVILRDSLQDYENRVAKKLQPAHIENSIIQTFAYREFLTKKAINYAFSQTFPQFANGVNLDLCGESVNCYRLPNESDEAFRVRVLLAPESFTTCGTIGSYEFHVRAASEDVADVYIHTPEGGIVEIFVLTKTGLPSEDLISQIYDYVSSDERRTLCDTVRVKSAEEISYQVSATLDVLIGMNKAAVLNEAKKALKDYLNTYSQQMGKDVVPLEIASVLKVPGVYNVHLSSPSLIEVESHQWANCSSITLSATEEQKIG